MFFRCHARGKPRVGLTSNPRSVLKKSRTVGRRQAGRHGFFHRRPEMAELFIQERAAFPHHHRPLYFAMRESDGKECRRADLFHRLSASGRIRSISQERFFAVIGDLLYGTILTNLLTGRRATPDAQTEDVLDVILNGILAEEGEER